MKHYLFVIIFSVLSANAAYAYTDNTDKFTIKFPKRWHVRKALLSNGSSHITAAEDPNSESKLMIVVSNDIVDPEQFKNEQAIKRLLQSNLRAARNLCPEPQLIDTGTPKFGKYRAFSSSYGCVDNTIVVFYMIPTKEKGYILTYSGSKEIARSHDMEIAITSFKILQ